MAKITHGLSKHPLMGIWHGIKCRCYTKSANGYPRYGGTGVKMCAEWKDDFKAFYDWAIANGWRKGLQVDKDIKAALLKVEPNLYSPERCSIVTAKLNGNSKKSNRILEFNGEKLTISQWADKTGIPRNAIRMRIESHGFTISEALTLPLGKVRDMKSRSKQIEFNGITKSLIEWSLITGVQRKTLGHRLTKGWSIEKALTTITGKTGKKK